MNRFLDSILPKSELGGIAFTASFVSFALYVLFNLGRILPREVLFLYGMGVFVLVPFFVGLLTPLVIGFRRPLMTAQSVGYAQIILVGVGLSMIFLAVEGLICLVMAYPIVAVFCLIGSLAGHSLQAKFAAKHSNIYSSFALFLLLVPGAMAWEKQAAPSERLTPVVTTVEINAPPEKVWRNVVEFPELAPPTELLFKTGVAYPIKAEIKGAGVGAIRYCEFSTGAFVEPITTWQENELLQFSVREQPIPMREISPYGSLDTPHLHDYFVSRRGQFKLTRLENGHTLLEGTTWYVHRIQPEFYWRFWTEQIVHTIHQRVLNHIKEQSEKQ